MLPFFVRNARPAVLYNECPAVVVGGTNCQRDTPASGVLDRVGKKILGDLTQLRRVSDYNIDCGILLRAEGQTFRDRERPKSTDQFLRKFVDTHRDESW